MEKQKVISGDKKAEPFNIGNLKLNDVLQQEFKNEKFVKN